LGEGLRNELIGLLSSFAAIIIFLSLRYFYKHRFEDNILQGKQKIIGVVVLIISILIALLLMQ
tara:strand:+ start:19191 stop:19379 length:189 start_codon:yes stop_codon:yes gene_type:complete